MRWSCALGDRKRATLTPHVLCPWACDPCSRAQACGALSACAWREDACAPLSLDADDAVEAAAAAEAHADETVSPSFLAAAGCEGAPTPSACAAAGTDCRWCVSRAVPSLCATAEEAVKLPPSVFRCAVPPSAVDAAVA